jgi:hypothetical protein
MDLRIPFNSKHGWLKVNKQRNRKRADPFFSQQKGETVLYTGWMGALFHAFVGFALSVYFFLRRSFAKVGLRDETQRFFSGLTQPIKKLSMPRFLP